MTVYSFCCGMMPQNFNSDMGTPQCYSNSIQPTRFQAELKRHTQQLMFLENTKRTLKNEKKITFKNICQVYFSA